MNQYVKLLYCMMLNKGRVFGNATDARMSLPIPITITQTSANETIRTICDAIATDAGEKPEVIDIINLTTYYDFCHFGHLYGSESDKAVGPRLLYTPKKSQFGTLFKRVK